jgi:hypothetical protein
MLTRCVDQVHVFLDTQTQGTGPYHDWHPVQALADRWTSDASKVTASSHLTPSDPYSADQPLTPPVFHLESHSGERVYALPRSREMPPFPSARQQLPVVPLMHVSDLDLSILDR